MACRTLAMRGDRPGGADGEQARAFADKVVPVSNLVTNHEQLRDAIVEIV